MAHRSFITISLEPICVICLPFYLPPAQIARMQKTAGWSRRCHDSSFPRRKTNFRAYSCDRGTIYPFAIFFFRVYIYTVGLISAWRIFEWNRLVGIIYEFEVMLVIASLSLFLFFFWRWSCYVCFDVLLRGISLRCCCAKERDFFSRVGKEGCFSVISTPFGWLFWEVIDGMLLYW